MKNFRFRSQDDPTINGDVDRLEEIYAHLTLAGHYPKKVLIVCSICDQRIVTGPRGASDPTAQGEQDRAWAKEHTHPIRKWWRRNFPVKVGIAALMFCALDHSYIHLFRAMDPHKQGIALLDRPSLYWCERFLSAAKALPPRSTFCELEKPRV